MKANPKYMTLSVHLETQKIAAVTKWLYENNQLGHVSFSNALRCAVDTLHHNASKQSDYYEFSSDEEALAYLDSIGLRSKQHKEPSGPIALSIATQEVLDKQLKEAQEELLKELDKDED